MMTPTGAASGTITRTVRELGQPPAGLEDRHAQRRFDAYGLMLSIADPNPVMVLLPSGAMRVRDERPIPGEPTDADELSRRIDAPIGDRTQWKPHWPPVEEHFVPLGVSRLVREGTTATVLSYGRTLPLCVQAADHWTKTEGWSFDVLDLRSIFPYDWQAISKSILKTGRVAIVNEDTEVTNFGEHLWHRRGSLLRSGRQARRVQGNTFRELV